MIFDCSMQSTRWRWLHAAVPGLVFGALAIFAAQPALAQSSNVEMAAELGGRIIGAAKACGLNAERIRRTSERLMSVMDSNVSSPAEREAARTLFLKSQGPGAEEVRGERSKCQTVHVEFSEMEIKLGRAPAADPDRVAVKRGVPALGSLKPEAATTRKQ